MTSLSVINHNSEGNIVSSLIANDGNQVARFDWRCTPNKRVVLVLVGTTLMFNCLQDTELDIETSVSALLDNYRKENRVTVIADGIAKWEMVGTAVLCWIGDKLIATFTTTDTKCGISVHRSVGEFKYNYYFNMFIRIPGISMLWDESYTPLLASYCEYIKTFE